jgi:hypothetical protein
MLSQVKKNMYLKTVKYVSYAGGYLELGFPRFLAIEVLVVTFDQNILQVHGNMSYNCTQAKQMPLYAKLSYVI